MVTPAAPATDPATTMPTGKAAPKPKITSKQKIAGGAVGLAVLVALYLKQRSAAAAAASTTPSTTAATDLAATAPLNAGWQGNSQQGNIGAMEAQIAALQGEFGALSGSGSTGPTGTPAPSPITTPGLSPSTTTGSTVPVPAAGGGSIQVPPNSAAALTEAADPTAPIFQSGVDPNSAFATNAGVQGTPGAGDSYAQSSPTDAWTSGFTDFLTANPGLTPAAAEASYESTAGGPPS